jgi:uncharacterized membrane protein HdeD (DUF308 family)
MATTDQGQMGRSSLKQLYLVRGVIAIVWAVIFAMIASSLTAGVIALLVIYPGIDVVASLMDARTHRGTGPGQVQMVNAALSFIALVGIAVASSISAAAVLVAFGAWASVSGIVMLFVAIRRRAQVGHQWAIYFSGGLSTVAGITFASMATAASPKLSSLAGYAGFGGVLFVVSALWLMRGSKAQ